MKFHSYSTRVLVTLLLYQLNFVVSDELPSEISVKWMTQKLNNFNPSDEKTWQMRYLEYDEHYRQGGPIFIFVGGEFDITTFWILRGLIIEMVKQFNGILFHIEHRYYGKSLPVPDTSTDNLKYLTVDQALEDLANFIATIKKENSTLKDSGVIFVGRSYAASLVTWFMKKYPHLATGAWASSGPILAQMNFKGNFERIFFK